MRAPKGVGFRTTNVRFGSKADICGATSHVRFTPNCDCKSGYLRFVMSALGQKRTFEFAPVETDVVKRMLPPSDIAEESRAGD
jgi:hypothetical protein